MMEKSAMSEFNPVSRILMGPGPKQCSLPGLSGDGHPGDRVSRSSAVWPAWTRSARC